MYSIHCYNVYTHCTHCIHCIHIELQVYTLRLQYLQCIRLSNRINLKKSTLVT